MSKQIEAMKLALKTLEQWDDPFYKRGRAIAVLREALAERPAPVQQEPDWLDKEQTETDWDHVWLLIKAASYASSKGFISGTTNWGSAVSRYMRNESPQPPAQPLTDERLLELLVGVDPEAKRIPLYLMRFIRAIEAAHGITKETT